MSDLPILPYAGTSGHSGTDTSAERAATEDAEGVTKRRQAAVLSMVDSFGFTGCTVVEVRAHLGLHHGQGSGALSNLHKAGLLVRLSERRGRCKVYVTPAHVQGRETEAHGRTAAHLRQFEMELLLSEASEQLSTPRCRWHSPSDPDHCGTCRANEWTRRYHALQVRELEE